MAINRGFKKIVLTIRDVDTIQTFDVISAKFGIYTSDKKRGKVRILQQ